MSVEPIHAELGRCAERVGRLLTQRRETIAIAESATGGLVSAALLAVPGASAYFIAGAVVYTGAARRTLLGIEPADIAPGRPCTEPYARLVAERARLRFEVTWALAETGAAGPTGNRYGDPAGTSYAAIAGPTPATVATRTGSDDRAANMARFALAALARLEAVLSEAVIA